MAERRAVRRLRCAKPGPRSLSLAGIWIVCERSPKHAMLSCFRVNRLEARKFDVLVHCTPVGMWPHVDECFFEKTIPAEIVFDMVYNPLETMLDQAGASGRQGYGCTGLTYVPRAGCKAVRDLDRRSGSRAAMERGGDGSSNASAAWPLRGSKCALRYNEEGDFR